MTVFYLAVIHAMLDGKLWPRRGQTLAQGPYVAY